MTKVTVGAISGDQPTAVPAPVVAASASGRRSRLGSRAEVLACLRRVGSPQPVTALAETAGLRLNTTRYHLDALVAEGLATRVSEPRIGPGRPKILYGPASPDPEMTAESYRSLADALLQQLSVLPGGAGDAAEAAGFAWGKSLAARRAERDGLARVVGTLGELGHELAVAGDPPRQIELRPCPFGEQLDADGDTVCRLHFGLIRGLAADDPEHRMAQLCPWVTPTSCLVALAQRPTAGAGAGEPTADSA